MSEGTPAPRPAPARRLSFSSELRERIHRGVDRLLGVDLVWSAALVIVVLVAWVAPRWGGGIPPLGWGERAPRDVYAPADLQVVDLETTERLRDAARAQVHDVYLHDPSRQQRAIAALRDLFAAGRQAQPRARAPGQDPREALRGSWPAGLPEEVWRALSAREFSPEVEQVLVDAVSETMRGLICDSRAILAAAPAIAVVHLPEEREETLRDYSGVLDLAAARERVRRAIEQRLELSAGTERLLAEWGASFVEANLVFDRTRTEQRRQQAAAAVAPVVEQIPRGSLLVRAGQRIGAQELARLEAGRAAGAAVFGFPQLAGAATVVLLLAFFLYRYARFDQRHFRGVRHLHALLVLGLLFMLAVALAIQWVARRLVASFPFPFNEIELYPYLIPMGAGPILVALLANGRIAMVYAAFLAVLFAAVSGFNFFLGLWALLVGWTGVYAISAYRERAALLRAGLVVGGAGAAATLAVEVLQGHWEPVGRTLFAAGLACVGGAVGVGLLISYILPLAERLFGVLTDLRLLELSNMNHPLLAELAVKAPGTYNHSLVLASLTEEAAKAVGANALLCRVAAFYHDIGKLAKPEYYVENMSGTNPHDKLAPSMSALIVASHVKEGIRLAREAGLPQQIVDIIPQHHGTRLMTYFYERAKQRSDPSHRAVKEEDFRYPGPKPQTKEAAIFMLADAVEAAARTLEDPTPGRLQDLIRRITSVIVLDGQLDECDLTFADLKRIQDAFLRTLVSFHHQRIDYPGFHFRRTAGRPTGSAREAPEPAPTASPPGPAGEA